jgi:hypothetical protein
LGLCDKLPFGTTIGTVLLLHTCSRLGYSLYVMYLQQAVSVLNKSNLPALSCHNTDLWWVLYCDDEKYLSQESRRFLSKSVV